MTRHRRLADTLAGADHVERRGPRQRQPRRRVEREAGAAVGSSRGQRGAHQQEALAVAEDRLVRQVHEDARSRLPHHTADRPHHVRRPAARVHGHEQRQPERGGEPGRAPRAAGQLAGGVVVAELLAAAGEDPGDDLVVRAQPLERGADDGWIVLAVDHDGGTRAGGRYRSSSATSRQVYFSKDAVEGSNSMSVSDPWKGYLRSTRTWSPSRVMML